MIPIRSISIVGRFPFVLFKIEYLLKDTKKGWVKVWMIFLKILGFNITNQSIKFKWIPAKYLQFDMSIYYKNNNISAMAECPCIHDDAGTDGLDTDKTSPTKLSKVEPSKITPPVKYDLTADSGQNFLLSEVSHFQLDKTGGQAELASMMMPALILGPTSKHN